VECEALGEARGEHDRDLIVSATREVLDGLRERILAGEDGLSAEDLRTPAVGTLVKAEIRRRLRPSLRPAINAAGIILHTGLGRALLPEAAVGALHDVARGYCTLATDLDTGRRGHRDAHLEELICRLTGAEAATVANNNAAATMLILNTLAEGREVIVSRGQLVEIGGSFRMPDVMEASGAILRDIGTTNRVHLRDYEAAIGENTGAILRVHQSNYRIVGFSSEPPLEDLVALGREHSLPVIDDLGSGALMDLSRYGLEPEPLAQESVRAGADVACFSGDKLIGGPQAGVIIGTHEVLERIKTNQLARAFRVGKLTIAAMEAALKLFLNPDTLEQTHPTYRMLALTPDELQRRAEALAEGLAELPPEIARVEVIDGFSQVGSGSVPAENLPTRLLSIRPDAISAGELARRLRHHDPAIFPRVHAGEVLLDPRTIQPEEDAIVIDALNELLREAAQ
jgi:L-seryl-tRNA(Ser) seleniumtransferase